MNDRSLETSRNWWCPLCEKEVPPERVTHDEVHDACYGGCDGKVYSTRQDAEIIRAQHDETGRVWAGPRACLPKGYSEVRSSKTVAVLTAAKITELTTKYPALGVDRFVHERDYEQLQREMEHRERYWAQFDHVPKGTAFETNTQPSSNSLLQRLREFETYHDNRKPLSPTGLCREAADEIERLQRENAELKATDGYVGAFYKIGELLGLTAMPISPKEAFETVMFPRLRQLVDGAAVETDAVLQIVRDVSTMDCFYSGSKCPSGCECLAARAEKALRHTEKTVAPQRWNIGLDGDICGAVLDERQDPNGDWVLWADIKHLFEKPPEKTAEVLDDVLAILYEDKDKCPEVFVGAGAEIGARRRFESVRDRWSCHLLRRVANGADRRAEKKNEPLHLFEVTESQKNFVVAVTGDAFRSGLTKEQFMHMVSIGWDARDDVRNSLKTDASAPPPQWQRRIVDALLDELPESERNCEHGIPHRFCTAAHELHKPCTHPVCGCKNKRDCERYPG